MGSFIFLGPTGSPRRTAQSLAEFLFDDEQGMIRIDMSEYMKTLRLIGAPGIRCWEGDNDGSSPTQTLQHHLFGEIEKAHYDVFNMLPSWKMVDHRFSWKNSGF